MAAAVTPANTDRQLEAMGDGYAFKGSIALSGNYATGGDPLDFGPIFQTIGVGTIDYVDIEDKAGYRRRLRLHEQEGHGAPGCGCW
jgi:hypothetical protein